MAPESPDYEKLEPIPHRYAYSGIILTVIIFQLINRVVVKVGLPETVDARDTWKWRNLFISWIHAVIVGIWDLLCFILYPQMVTDLIAYHNYVLYAVVVFSTGYFIHDFLDMMVNNKLFKLWEVSIHHIAVAGIFGFNAFTSRCLPYNAIALLAEVNSMFLHARKLLQMRKVSFSNLFYRINVWVNLGTFIVCRFLPLVWIGYGVYYEHHRVSSLYLACLAFSVFIMWGINIVLFYRLVKNDIIRPLSASLKTDSEVLENGVKNISMNSNNNEKLMNGTKHKLN